MHSNLEGTTHFVTCISNSTNHSQGLRRNGTWQIQYISGYIVTQDKHEKSF